MSRWCILWEEEVTSTMDAVLPHLEEGAFVALGADHQTKGRGRMGRVWNDTRGTLTVSLAFQCDKPLADIPQMTFVASLALYETVKSFAPHAPFSLKWPNDVMLDGVKMAGLLVEIHTRHSAPLPWIIIGMGVNVAASPTVKARTVACLGDVVPHPPLPRDFLTHFLGYFDHEVDLWTKAGFAPIRDRWREGAHKKGTPLLVHKGKERIEGSFLDLDASGRLLLEREDGTHICVSVADVFLKKEQSP